MIAPERIWIDEDTWFAGPGITERAVEYTRADIIDAMIDEAVAKERERADKAESELRVAIGGCDANDGWAHDPISLDGGKYNFCNKCGETLTKAVAKAAVSAAAIRAGKGE